jgi:cyclase
MSKFRIIPIILIDGINVVKGNKFDSWRPIGSIIPALNIFESRDVDELMLIDVRATKESRNIDFDLVKEASRILSVPLTVGGGINSLSSIEYALKSGADKVLLGTSPVTVPDLVSEASDNFGSQSIICSIDIKSNQSDSIYVNSGTCKIPITPKIYAKELADAGTGEILIQTIDRDGMLEGMDLKLPMEIKLENPSTPILVSGGFSSEDQLNEIYLNGFSGVGVGALFQFTQVTPNGLRSYMLNSGFRTRKIRSN